MGPSATPVHSGRLADVLGSAGILAGGSEIQFDVDAGSLGGRAVQDEPAAEGLNPVSLTLQAPAGSHDRSARSVIAVLQDESLTFQGQGNRHARAVGVFLDVSEGFGGDEVHRGFDLRGESVWEIDAQLDGDRAV